MGFLTTYLAFRAGQRRRQACRDDDLPESTMTQTCANCGYQRVQHDDEGRCPRYE